MTDPNQPPRNAEGHPSEEDPQRSAGALGSGVGQNPWGAPGFGDTQGYGGAPEYGGTPGYGNPQAYGNAPAYGNPQGSGGAPGYGNPPAYGNAPGYTGAPGYGAEPRFGEPQPTFQQQPAYQQRYGQIYGEPQPEPAPPAWAPAAHAKKSKLPVMIAVAVTVVALVAAGVVLAGSRGWFTASGASSPNQAVEKVFQSLADGDLLGVAAQLAPSEAGMTADLTGDMLDQLKRLEIVNSSATADQLYSLTITSKDLTLAPTPIPINDHVQVVRITGGTLTVDGIGGTDALTPKIRAAMPDLADVAPSTATFDIATQTAETGNALRIATVNVDGRWYPSVAYTIADNAAFTSIGPDYAARLAPIAAAGAATPQQAMDKLLQALVAGDTEQIVSLLDPGTMGAVHDYASLAFADSGRCLWNGLLTGSGANPATGGACEPLDVQVASATWTTTAVTGGQKVAIGSLTFDTPDGQMTITRDPSVPSMTITGLGEKPIVIDPSDVPDFFATLSGTFGVDLSGESGQVTDIVARELEQVLNLGVIMVQGADDLWYTSPLHTYSDVVVSLLRGLQPADIDFFLQQGH
jgi:hypothetical protein